MICVRLLKIFFVITLLLTSTANAQWRLDGDSSAKLRNFRIDDQLKVSASAQPSVAALKTLKEKIPDGVPIYIVDLRQESHGFVNGVPVSWYQQYNEANDGIVDGEIVERDEIERLNALKGERETFEPLGNSDKKAFKPLTVKVKSVMTERDAATAAGFNYIRFAAKDMSAPDSPVVNEFVQFVEQLPPDAWLHFHCQAGSGRTTLFMALYDIILNPQKSLEEIVERQMKLGGANLLAENDGDDWYAQHHRKRADMLRGFYQHYQQRQLEAAPSFDMPLVSISQPLDSVMILGQATATQKQMIRLINRRNPYPKLTCSVEELVQGYYEEAGREGVRADIALCQALKETGFFNYGGDVDPKQNNFCGLGATGNRVKGAAFDSAQLGARAHIQHLLAYCTTRRPSTEVIDPRYELASAARKVKINNWIGLGGTWAVPGVYYGQDLLNLWRQALAPDGSDQSIAIADRKVKSNPNDAVALVERGIALFNGNRIAQAIEDYTKAVKINPTVEGYYNRALAHERLNDYGSAIDDYSKALALDALFPQAWYNRGCAYMLDGQYDAALADFNHLLKFVPQSANAKNNIAVIHARRGDLNQAAIDLKEAARINSNNEFVRRNLIRFNAEEAAH